MDASKARVWDMTFKLQYAKMELQKWRFQETPNASMQFELSTGFLIAECVLHARRIFTLCRHFMGNIAWNRNMLGTLYEMEWFTTNHNRSLTFKYSFKCNTKAAALADEWPGSWCHPAVPCPGGQCATSATTRGCRAPLRLILNSHSSSQSAVAPRPGNMSTHTLNTGKIFE